MIVSITLFPNYAKAHQMATTDSNLNTKEKSIITIASLTAKGDLVKLKLALNIGLEAGLTVNEVKEVLVHTYAYCGFPRSIRGLQIFMEVLNERKAKGIIDEPGKEASPIKEEGNKYERGKNILEQLTKTPQSDTLTGYSAFAPVIDTFLKEHLFAAIFERDILTYTQRELVTISVISTIGNAEPMLKGHLSISLNVGISPEQLKEFIDVIKPIIGKKKTKAAKEVVNEVLKNR
ncbi:MAG: carboxymuconolactone decarboxylase family protein [bacterium]|nr:carboxymuconolactone decarboxylase family protein [bacterium]